MAASCATCFPGFFQPKLELLPKRRIEPVFLTDLLKQKLSVFANHERKRKTGKIELLAQLTVRIDVASKTNVVLLPKRLKHFRSILIDVDADDGQALVSVSVG